MAKKRNAGSGDIDPKLVKTAAQNCAQIKSLIDENNDDIKEELNAFERGGGHKTALRNAMKFMKQLGENPAKARDHWRALESYLHILGFHDQLDMFEKTEAAGEAGEAAVH